MLKGKELGEAIRRAIEMKIAGGAIASKAEVARHFGVRPPSIHDWIKKGSISKDKLPELWRYFSDVVGMDHWGMSGSAAKMAASIGVNIGEGPMQGNASPQPLPAIATEANIVSIPQFDAGGRMGNGGLILQDQPGLIRSWDVSREWLNQNVKGVTGNSKLCIVTGFGDSMKPMFNPGDPLLVDLSVHTVDYDAVYFFRVGHEGFIKRIQRIPGQGIRAISANRDHYEPWTITEDMDFEVLGRVLKVWKGDDF